MNNLTDCPVCGSTEMKRVTHNETFIYKGREIQIKDYTIYQCNNCGEGFADPESRKKEESLLQDEQLS